MWYPGWDPEQKQEIGEKLRKSINTWALANNSNVLLWLINYDKCSRIA